jgi:hypothetical protein
LTVLLNRKVPDLYDPIIGGLPDLKGFQFCTDHGSSEGITLQEKSETEGGKNLILIHNTPLPQLKMK